MRKAKYENPYPIKTCQHQELNAIRRMEGEDICWAELSAQAIYGIFGPRTLAATRALNHWSNTMPKQDIPQNEGTIKPGAHDRRSQEADAKKKALQRLLAQRQVQESAELDEETENRINSWRSHYQSLDTFVVGQMEKLKEHDRQYCHRPVEQEANSAARSVVNHYPDRVLICLMMKWRNDSGKGRMFPITHKSCQTGRPGYD